MLWSVQSLVSSPVGTRDVIYVSSKTFTCFEMGPPVLRKERSDYYWPLLLNWGVTCGSLTLCGQLYDPTALSSEEHHRTRYLGGSTEDIGLCYY
jgi:hypothetical protein